MRPTKAKDVLIDYAKEIGQPEKLVSDLIRAYYSEVRKKLTSLECHRVGLEGLGIFTPKRKALIDSIEYYTKLLEEQPELIERFGHRLEGIKFLLKTVDEESNYSYQFKAKRYESKFT